MKAKIKVSNLNCMMCARSITEHFKKLNITTNINITNKEVTFDGAKNINYKYLSKELARIGFIAVKNDEKSHKKELVLERLTLIFSTLLVIPFLILIVGHFKKDLLPTIFHDGLFQLIFAAPMQFIIGYRFYKGAYFQIKKKNPGMDVLVVLGTSIAFGYSLYLYFAKANPHELYFKTSSLIIWMVIIGEYLEYISKNHSQNTLKELLSLTPKNTIKMVLDTETEVSIDNLKINDIIKVLPNQVIPIDGVLISNNTYINEASITGENKPKYKVANDEVIGGTINLGDPILMKVTKLGKDTVLNKIISAVEDSQLIKPKSQRLADIISKYFVVTIISIALISFIGAFFYTNRNITKALEIAIAILVISCPCALGLATPTSIACASAVAYKNKVLFKDAKFFEIAPKIDIICFDKTGTLTKDSLKVINILGSDEYLKYIYSLEKASIHPLSKSISKYINSKDLLETTNFEIIPKTGIKGIIDNKEIIISRYDYLNKIDNPFVKDLDEYANHTLLKVFVNQKLTNIIILEAFIKDDAKRIINYLKKKKITPYILSGDNIETTKKIANDLGITNYYGELLPENKQRIIKDLQANKKVVAFIGDGINDTLALKQADISISVNNASDIAQESADIVSLKDDLSLLLLAIDLSKKARVNIIENLLWAFCYNIITIPLAISNIISPVIAGFLHIISSLTVVFNALRVLAYKFRLYNKKQIKIKKEITLDLYNKISSTLIDNNIEFEIIQNKKQVIVNKADFSLAKQKITSLI